MRTLLSSLLYLIFCLGPVSAKETLIYSAASDYAPMSWLENNKLIGVGPEIAERIFSEMGITVESQTYPWARVLELTRQGRIDVIVSLYFNTEREQFLTYSDTHFSEVRTVLITRKGHEFPFNQWADLVGRTGGSVLDYSWGDEFDRYIEAHLDIENVYSTTQNFMKLLHGRIEYMITTENHARILSKQLELTDKITILPVAVNTEKEYIAFSKSSPFIEYLPQFNAKLREMIESGEVERLIEKYIDKASMDLPPHPNN
ncbi:substrate-binding periplasmic protein [Vibrio sp. HN007]|uniref:substrate-binding periplasmic protein n=1 Tax=Vibrio iocasae TaxID=3098914 RepID=UPI0035D467C8